MDQQVEWFGDWLRAALAERGMMQLHYQPPVGTGPWPSKMLSTCSLTCSMTRFGRGKPRPFKASGRT